MGAKQANPLGEGLCLAKFTILCRIKYISWVPCMVFTRVKLSHAPLAEVSALLGCWLLSLSHDLLLENLALRQQLSVLKRQHPQLRLAASGCLFRVMLRRLWSGWKRALILIQPETVVRWHRAGFKLYWTRHSGHRFRVGRKCVSWEMRKLIFRMVAENPTWGSPCIHGELKMLGFDISERTV